MRTDLSLSSCHTLRSRLAEASTSPDSKGFCVAIDACGRGAAWHAALAFFATARVRLDLAMVNAMGTACTRGGEWARALHILLHTGVEPDVVTYGSVIAACSLGSQWMLASAVLHEMRFRGVAASPACVGAAVAACETVGRSSK